MVKKPPKEPDHARTGKHDVGANRLTTARREQNAAARDEDDIPDPCSMTKLRNTNTVIRALQRSGGRLGVACLCIGGGEASAIAVERCE